MNIKTSKYLYWFVSFTSIVIIFMTIYYYMGGFDPIKVSHTGKANYAIAGKWLKGHVTNTQEGLLFNEIKETVLNKKVDGELCIVNYQNDTLEDREIARFIGVLLKNEIAAIPSDLEIVEITSEDSFMAALTMHPLVMPNSEKTEQMILDSAAAHSIPLKKMTLEVLYPDNSVIIQMFSED